MSGPVGGVAEKLEAKAARFVKDKRLPGAAVGVIHGDDLVWSAGIGFADIASRRAPDTSTLYRIASITKTFTAAAIVQQARSRSRPKGRTVDRSTLRC
jgi:CubicO group peptidase (beta-lactamase class C family)